MSLWEALEDSDVRRVRQICADHHYDVNEWKTREVYYNSEVGDEAEEDKTPLMWCAEMADDVLNKQGHVKENEHMQIMRIILQHPMCRVNLQCPQNGRSALYYACNRVRSLSAARLLLSHPYTDLGQQEEEHGFTVLHALVEGWNDYIRFDNVSTAEALLDELVKHPKIDECVNKLDKYGQSALDICITDENFNAYDIELCDALKQRFLKVAKAHANVSISRRTLALAGTIASPYVFCTLIKYGANVNDSLKNGETTAFCVISRNSLSKCKSLFQHNPVLTTKWNNLTPIQMANEYGCKTEIKQLIATLTGESLGLVRPINTGKTHCNEIPSKCEKLSKSDLKHYRTHLSSKVRLDERVTHGGVWNNHDSLIAIRYHRHFITESTEHIEETKQITHNIMDFFSNMSQRLENSSGHRHMAYKHFLCGSMGDGSKTFLPDEFDIDCVFDEAEYQDSGFINMSEIQPNPGSGWRKLCNNKGFLVVSTAAQAFYQEFARLCHEHNTSLQHQTRGIVKVLFQYMSKISRLKITWNGLVFRDLCIYVDVVPVFKLSGHTEEFPLSVKSNTYYALAKINRHEVHFQEDTLFPISVSDAEARVMRALPEPIRQGFTTAKAVRQASICAPGIDFEKYNLAEDLAIEDYLTSHSLKNCLLNILQNVQEKQNTTRRFPDTPCKYAFADLIYEEFQSAIENKNMKGWYDMDFLLDCRHCKLDIYVCCQKRNIRLALVSQIRAWLTNTDNLRFLHDANHCTCTYSQREIEDYHTTMARLLQTGTLFDVETESQRDPLVGSSPYSTVQSPTPSGNKLIQDSSSKECVEEGAGVKKNEGNAGNTDGSALAEARLPSVNQ